MSSSLEAIFVYVRRGTRFFYRSPEMALLYLLTRLFFPQGYFGKECTDRLVPLAIILLLIAAFQSSPFAVALNIRS